MTTVTVKASAGEGKEVHVTHANSNTKVGTVEHVLQDGDEHDFEVSGTSSIHVREINKADTPAVFAGKTKKRK